MKVLGPVLLFQLVSRETHLQVLFQGNCGIFLMYFQQLFQWETPQISIS